MKLERHEVNCFLVNLMFIATKLVLEAVPNCSSYIHYLIFHSMLVKHYTYK